MVLSDKDRGYLASWASSLFLDQKGKEEEWEYYDSLFPVEG